MELEKAKKILMDFPEYQDLVSKECEAIDTVIAELHAMQNLLDEKREELEHLQKENEDLKNIDLTTVYLKGVADEKERWRNKIREKIEELKEENYQISLNSKVTFDSGMMKNNLKISVLEDLLKEE